MGLSNPKNLISKFDSGYELLDSGEGEKLEMLIGHKLIRSCPQAIWKKNNPQLWTKNIEGVNKKSKDGKGQWQFTKGAIDLKPFQFQTISKSDLKFSLKLTPFGHCGLFFEQRPVWDWLDLQVQTFKKKFNRPPLVLNLFGYTGAASLVMACAGAKVWHVDSAKGVLDWGKTSQQLSQINENDIQWIHDDCLNFVTRMEKKNQKFDGILCDPPSWGHGNKKQKWVFEDSISHLHEKNLSILNQKAAFYMLTTHTPGVWPSALMNLMNEVEWDVVDFGEITLSHHSDQRLLPSGIFTWALRGLT